MRLKDSRVWVTGASSGIGEALVEPLLRAGARVAISARGRERLEAIAARDSGPNGELLPVAADVTDREAVRAAAGQIEATWGGIDLAIFNAGMYQPVSGTALDADAFSGQMAVNFTGVAYGLEAVLPGMLRRGSGHVAAVSSLTAYLPLPNAAAYGASKAALTYMMRALRFDLQPRGVRVTVVHPGFVRTPLTDRNRFKMPALVEVGAAADVIVNGLSRDRDQIDFPGRLAWPVKIASCVPYALYGSLVQLGLRLGGRSRI